MPVPSSPFTLQEAPIPNGAHGDRSETVTRSRGRPRKVAVSEAQHIPASARDIHVAAERDNLEAEACELVRPYHRGEWESQAWLLRLLGGSKNALARRL